MKADAKHEKHHADLGQLTRHGTIGDKAGSGRADNYPCHQITDQRREA